MAHVVAETIIRTIGTSATQLQDTTKLTGNFVLVSDPDNTDPITVGDVNINTSGRGYTLNPGGSLAFPELFKDNQELSNLYDLSGYYAISTASDQLLTICINCGQPDGFPQSVVTSSGTGSSFAVTTSRTEDSISSALDSSNVMDGLTALTPKFAEIDATASGTTTLINAVTGKKLRVLSLNFICGGQVDVEFRSGASTALTGAYELVANSGLVLPFSPVGHFETASGAALVIHLSGAQPVDGSLVYVEV